MNEATQYTEKFFFWSHERSQMVTNDCFFSQLRVVQEIDDELTNTHKESKLDDNSLSSGDEQKLIVPRKASVLSVMGMKELAQSNSSDQHARTVRAKCVEELLNTEKDYVKMLKNIIEVSMLEKLG